MHVVVVGAGPGGLMAAEMLATAGHKVSIYDQRRSPARKFVLAGRGGLNLTHSEPLDAFLERYGPEREQLEPAIRAFTPDDLRTWCADLGHETFIGSSGRVFPRELRAVPLLRSWLARLSDLGVSMHLRHQWTGWTGNGAACFDAPDGPIEVAGDATILALGGASWPGVGSDGSWQKILRDEGIEMRSLEAANCGVEVEWSDVMVERFAGEPVKNAAIIVDGLAVRGDPIVTKSGLEGGPIYAHGRRIRDRRTSGVNTIEIDLFPDLDVDTLEVRLTSKRKERDSTANWLRRCGVSPVGASLMREATGNALPRDASAVAQLAKAIPIEVVSMSSIDRAISSAGGVAWSEVDASLQLRSMPGTYVVGEMLDWEAPTGGYLLQACFSTGRWAASSIVEA